MSRRKSMILMCDFETTVYKNQDHTEVWASACVELGTDDVKIFHSIDETFEYFKSLKCNLICYYHNLKFDGAFWLSYLIQDLGMKQAITQTSEDINSMEWIPTQLMKDNTFKYSISDMGQWYTITIKTHNQIIEIRDSLKLLPFSVKAIGKSFKTTHQKLDMEYTGFRYAGCEITDAEKEYIGNDVLVVNEALQIMYKQGHNKLTIGACCLAEYKRLIGKSLYEKYHPNLYEIELDKDTYGSETVGDYIRKSYRGGWCYLVKGKENKVYHNGVTADVNSLYPSMMSSESLNKYPVGTPVFWKGNEIPEEAKAVDKFYFVRIRTRFYLRRGKLPFVQVKNTLLYKANEMLETSDIRDKEGFYHDTVKMPDGSIRPAYLEMTLTMTDFILLKEHYELVDFEILDGCYFDAVVGIFDAYIEKYKKIKLESKGALRQLAKLFLNNLYGKMASNTRSSFKVAFLKDDKSVGFYTVIQNDKTPGYIPVGSAITSYARNFTIRAAQKNFYGVNNRGFIYADTDSIHCDLKAEELIGIKVHDKDFCCWKLESYWDEAIFVRQKTYIEHVTHEDMEAIENPYYNVKCAGMPDKCKNLFIESMKGGEVDENRPEEEKKFLKKKRDITDFKVGLKIPGKLLPKRINGGIVLTETTYEMR